jgi:AcrR family transcriptional regulator
VESKGAADRAAADQADARPQGLEGGEDLHVTHPTARRMITAARTILARDGFAALTLEAVAAEAGVNKASTRYYFGNKEGLINATMAEIVLDECADHRPPDSPMTPQERVDAIIENVRAIALNPDSFTGFFELLPQATKSEAIDRHFVRLYETWFDSNVDWLDLREGQVPADVRRGLAMLLSAIIDGIAVQETIFGAAYQPEATLDALRRLLVAVVPGLSGSEQAPRPTTSREASMDDMVGYCGLKCHDCPTLRAADDAARRSIAEHWATAYADCFPEGLTANSVNCTGCKGTDDALFAYCRTCAVRLCARSRGHDTCAVCDEYPTCAALAEFHRAAPEARTVLEAIRRGEPFDHIDSFK